MSPEMAEAKIFSIFLSAYSVLSDCKNVVNLAIGLGMDKSYPDRFADLQVDCCKVDDVYCSSVVFQISWSGTGAYGKLDGTINGTAIPKYVRYLDLGSNMITGNIPAIPSIYMNNLYLNINNLNGTLPSLPPNLQLLWVDQNNLHGDVPYLPSSLLQLNLGYPTHSGNHFTGIVKLNAPNDLYLNGNWITDLIINDPNQLDGACDISNNPLLNNPNIRSLTMCVQEDLYDAKMLSNTIMSFTTTISSTNSGTENPETTNEEPEANISRSTTVFRKRLSSSATREFLKSTVSSTTKSIRNEKIPISTVLVDISLAFILDFTGYSVVQTIVLVLRILVDAWFTFYIIFTVPFKREWKSRHISKVSGISLLN